jgi:hypothetical protein
MSETKGEKVVTKELNYSIKESIHPSYKKSRVLTQNGSQSVSLSNTGTSESLFELPTKVFNFAQSKLKFNVAYAAGAAYVWRWKDNIAPIYGIQLYTRGGQFICDISQGLPNWLKIARKAQTKLADYETYEETDGLYKSNQPVNNQISYSIPSEAFVWTKIGTESAFAISVAGTGGGGTVAPTTTTTIGSTSSSFRPNGDRINVNYTENTYAKVSGSATADTDYYEIPLSAFKDTILSLDKDITFPEIVYMRIIWNKGTSMCWNGTSATNPSTGATTWAGTAPTVGGLQLYLAVEQNTGIVSSVVSQMKSGGLTVAIPYLYSYKTALSGTSQNLSTRLNSGHGISLLKAITVPYDRAEDVNTTYNHNNLSAARVTSLYTLMNNNRLQEFDIECKANTDLDWMAMFDKLKGSVIQSKDMYKYNWFYEDSFDYVTGMNDEKNVDEQNLMSGLSLKEEIKYDVYTTIPSFTVGTDTNSPINWWSFFVVNRMLHIASDKITLK